MSTVEMAEQRLLLAKVEDGTQSVLLYVDRDYFELTHRQSGRWRRSTTTWYKETKSPV